MKKIKKKPQSVIIKEKLMGMIFILIMSIPVYYFVLLNAQKQDRPFDLRIAEAIIGTMIDIASPAFWTFLVLSIGLFEIGRLSFQYYRQKRQEETDETRKIE